MPVWSDKLIQEVIRLTLEAYYEPQFSDHSHGFRPKRSCATALREIYYNWHGTTWFIEGDISQCFDKLNHELLLQTLRENIHDGRFINFMRELFDAGYMEDWTFNKTLSGVPQGGIVRPILSNILLDKLDKFVETVLIPKYTRGVKRRDNAEYVKLINSSHRQRRKGHVQQAEDLKRQAQTLPSVTLLANERKSAIRKPGHPQGDAPPIHERAYQATGYGRGDPCGRPGFGRCHARFHHLRHSPTESSVDTNDPDYRRLRYVRYADDFLLGFIGPREEAEEIKQQLGTFLQEDLKLELSQAKTLITHARTEAARFLGYEITALQDNPKRILRNTNGFGTKTMCRNINSKPG